MDSLKMPADLVAAVDAVLLEGLPSELKSAIDLARKLGASQATLKHFCRVKCGPATLTYLACEAYIERMAACEN